MPVSRPRSNGLPASNGAPATPADGPDRLRPYAFHGVSLANDAGTHAVGDCPFCGREGKFSVDVGTGLWRCFVCGTGTNNGGGNALVFSRLIHENAAALNVANPGGFPAVVAVDRGLLHGATAAAWGVAQAAGGTWLVPGYAPDGRLDQVYRRVKVQEKGGWVYKLLPTPGIWSEGKVHALHLAFSDYDPARPNIMICEGPWDGMALWEVWDRHDKTTNIIAVPGCNVWRDEWTEMCRAKNVTLLYDSDHPREHTPGKVSRAGYDGMARVARRLSLAAASVKIVGWGPEGYDPDRPSGWDVRDHLKGANREPLRRAYLNDLLSKVTDAPKEWFVGAITTAGAHTGGGIEPLPCCTFDACDEAWDGSKGGAMRWRDDMRDALAVLFAVCASTQQAGNQLFLDLVGSAGSGKTTLCDGLLVSAHCHHLEHLTGFHSGWKLPEDGTKDCSLVARINGKTLVTPEFDILRSSPRYTELMGQTRRLFDGKSGATYKNSEKDTLYVGLRTPWIRAGTPAIMDCDQSQLGDRFLRIIINDPPTEDEKRAIIRSALRSERAAMLDTANGTAGSVVDAKTRRAYALTGGYVDWLRAHIEEELVKIEVSETAEDYCIDLAELSADLRARPNEDKRKVEVHDTKELPTRLARQNIRLAACLAVVLNKTSVDAEVLRITRKVALDTAAGHSLKIVAWICAPNPKADYRLFQECGGLGESILQTWTTMDAERLKKYLAFMRKIDIVDWQSGNQNKGTWVLTDRAYELYLRVMKDQ